MCFELRVVFECAILGEDLLCGVAGRFYEMRIFEGFHGEVGHAGLDVSQELAGAAELQIAFCELEAVFCFGD